MLGQNLTGGNSNKDFLKPALSSDVDCKVYWGSSFSFNLMIICRYMYGHVTAVTHAVGLSVSVNKQHSGYTYVLL